MNLVKYFKYYLNTFKGPMCGVLRLSRRVVLTLFYALLEQAFVASCKYNLQL